jgi:hypothetical protein
MGETGQWAIAGLHYHLFPSFSFSILSFIFCVFLHIDYIHNIFTYHLFFHRDKCRIGFSWNRHVSTLPWCIFMWSRTTDPICSTIYSANYYFYIGSTFNSRNIGMTEKINFFKSKFVYFLFFTLNFFGFFYDCIINIIVIILANTNNRLMFILEILVSQGILQGY